MLAIDTNIVIRCLTADDPMQSPRAQALVRSNDVFVSRTVLLECEWVLRSLYRLPPDQVLEALRAFVGMPWVSLESPAAIAEAFDQAGRGMDLADALHLAAAGTCEALITFDRDFIRSARAIGIDRVREP